MTISASVGRSGANLRADVIRIQESLNIARRLTHLPPIGVDGWVGPLTIGAITDFQRGAATPTDGRIDPRGPTLKALEKVVSAALEPAIP